MGSMLRMRNLFLGENRLSGYVPAQLGSLVELLDAQPP